MIARLALLAMVTLLPLRAAEPLRIGIIGLDTSHVPAFAKTYNVPTAPGYVPGGRVVAAFKGGSVDIEASASRGSGRLTITLRARL